MFIESCALSEIVRFRIRPVVAVSSPATPGQRLSGLIGAHEIGSMQPMGTTEDIIGEVLHRQPGFIDVPDAVFVELKKHFSERQIVELTMLIGAVVGIGIFKTPPIVAANSDSARLCKSQRSTCQP